MDYVAAHRRECGHGRYGKDLTGQAFIHRFERIFLDEITDAEDVNIRIFFPAMLHSPGVKPQIQKIAYFL